MRREFAPPAALAGLLARGLAGAGFDYKAARGEEAIVLSCGRPALWTDLRLSGEALQPHISTSVELTLDEMCEVYERYVAGFILTRQLSVGGTEDQWLRQQLQFTARQTRQIFLSPGIQPLRQTVHWHLVQMAGLIAQNFECRVEESPDTFAVYTEKEGFKFGVMGGRMLSNIAKPIPVRFMASSSARLQDACPEEHFGVAAPTLYDTMQKWLEVRAEVLRDAHAPLATALTAMRWRSPYVVPAPLQTLAMRDYSKDRLREACEEARGFRDLSAPLEGLRTLFVPYFMTTSAFNEHFGTPYARAHDTVTSDVAAAWEAAINSLVPAEEEATA